MSKFKVGDRVKVLRAFTDEESPLLTWEKEMDLCVGKEGIIICVDEDGAGWVSFAHDRAGWMFPPFVLEKVED